MTRMLKNRVGVLLLKPQSVELALGRQEGKAAKCIKFVTFDAHRLLTINITQYSTYPSLSCYNILLLFPSRDTQMLENLNCPLVTKGSCLMKILNRNSILWIQIAPEYQPRGSIDSILEKSMLSCTGPVICHRRNGHCPWRICLKRKFMWILQTCGQLEKRPQTIDKLILCSLCIHTLILPPENIHP